MARKDKTNSTFEESFRGHMDFLDALRNETQIGQVLIAASYFDERLRIIIEDFLIKGVKAKDLLDGPHAPLGTFSARIKVAQALGLINTREAKSLDAIRNVRNAFAHNIRAKLSDPKISKMLNALGWVVGENVTDVSKYDPEEVFFLAHHRIAMLLFNRPDHVRASRLVARDWSQRRVDYDPEWEED